MKKFLIVIIAFIFATCQPSAKRFPIPSFDVLLLNSSTKLNISKIDIDQPITIIYFSPDCEHCQKKTGSILHSMDSLKNLRFFFNER